MWRHLKHPLSLSILTLVALYILFAFVLQPALPKSLLIQYMVICAVGIVLVMSFEDHTAARCAQPIKALLGDPQLKFPRQIALAIVMVGTAALTYSYIKPGNTSPVELRTVHPAPPSTLRIYGKTHNLLKLENPVRKANPKGTPGYAKVVSQGGELYYKNCIFCHGDLLDGQGHFAKALNPRPANFQDVGTIAQLQESYLFWRIATGGPGLPREGSPWASAMPVWHEMLSEDDIWKIITFLYDYTGQVPRSWELEPKADKKAKTVAKSKAAGDKPVGLGEKEITRIYQKRCAHCHGADGDGAGPAAEFMYPKPRDFTLAVFKYKTTHADDEFPSDADLRKTIKDGLPGTAMPGWKAILSDAETNALIKKIKQFGEWEDESPERTPIAEGKQVASSKSSIEKGRKLFLKVCEKCHGRLGRGNTTSGKRLKDDWENRIWPRNLTRPETWRFTKNAQNIFQRISTGIRGTPMPEHSTTMSIKDRWHVANYVMSLRENAVPLSEGETVIRAARIKGALPDGPNDKAWDAAPAITFALAPNVIKEPRLFSSLNETVTVRTLYNNTDIVIRVDVDDRTFSVPGDKLEKQYRLDGVTPTRDSIAIQLPVKIPLTSEKPWFRHGDRKLGVNMWHWTAPSLDPKSNERVVVLDASGPSKPPKPRAGQSGLSGKGVWKDGQWRVVFKRALKTGNATDIQFKKGRYIPISFANWDGLRGEKGGRHSFTGWYWILIEPQPNLAFLYGAPTGTGLLAGFLFLLAARRQRRSFNAG